MKNNEIRQLSINTGKIERSEDTDKKKLRGYAVVFDDTYEYMDWWTGEKWTERVDPKAFDGVDMSSVLMLRDHDYSRVLGRNGKNLRLEVDEKGLFFEVDLPDTELARETYALAESEICDQCSFGFTVKEFKTDKGNKIETITKVNKLYEITVTPIPAYRSTVVVTMAENRKVKFEAEKQQREAEQKAKQEADKAELSKREAEQKNLQEAKIIELRKKLGV